VLDIQGVEAISPSLVDELILAFSGEPIRCKRLRLKGLPSRLSDKFLAIGRGHGIAIEETPAHDWRLAAKAQHVPARF
jgi:hypothetical protein